MRVEIQVKSSLLKWGRQEQGSEEIDFQALFKDYWNSKAPQFLVRGQLESPTSPFITDREGAADIIARKHSHPLELHFSVEVTVRLLTMVHHRLLILFA